MQTGLTQQATPTSADALARAYADLELISRELLRGGHGEERELQLARAYVLAQERVARLDRWYFCRNLAITQDEHNKVEPFAPFPDHPYLRELAREWDECARKTGNRILYILKSRQIMASWSACAMVLWSSLFERAQTIGWQSKKAEDANWMLKSRIFGMWERLPELVRRRHPCEDREGELRFPYTFDDFGRKVDLKNVVMGLPEGPDKPRQFTWSLFVSDESAFQDRSFETYVACQPAIRGGGMYVSISTAAMSHHYDMCEDRKYQQ